MTEFIRSFVNNGVLLKLALAALGGLVIGLERELKGKPLGLKTCLVVSLVSCLLTVVSYESAYLYSKPYSRPMDPGRIPSYVVSGIGFLGAGVILRKGNEAISGLTTASLVLASASIGIAVGAGFYIEAFTAIVFIILGVKLIPQLFERMGPQKLKEKEIKVKLFVEKTTDLTSLLKGIKEKKLGVKRVKIKEEADDIVLYCNVTTFKHTYTTDIYYELKSLQGVIQVEAESLE
jgi:putative Mg2+ transporter-C (MgtC) family protein